MSTGTKDRIDEAIADVAAALAASRRLRDELEAEMAAIVAEADIASPYTAAVKA